MNLRTKVFTQVVRGALSQPAETALRTTLELGRRLRGAPHIVTAYLRHDDPYSLLLLRRLPKLLAGYEIELRLCFIGAERPLQFTPAPQALALYARRDVAYMAPMLGEVFADAANERYAAGVSAICALTGARDDTEQALADLLHAVEAFWSGNEEVLAKLVHPLNPIRLEKARQIMRDNTAELLARRHYSPAMLHYAGEWYWGVDRLHYLLDRLDALKLRRTGGGEARSDLRGIPARLNPKWPTANRGPRGTRLQYFHSFRSPYAYLALERTFSFADRFGLTLEVRPVLPMVLRGLAVPRAKQLYILRDAAREARRLGIPFGNICDPLAAARPCIALFTAARRAGCERAFLSAVGRASWAQGRDLADDETLNAAAREAGLTDDAIREALASEDPKSIAAENREHLTAAGLWGVPSYRLGDVSVWGQDRLGVLANHLL